jgi:hypothetical protein
MLFEKRSANLRAVEAGAAKATMNIRYEPAADVLEVPT